MSFIKGPLGQIIGGTILIAAGFIPIPGFQFLQPIGVGMVAGGLSQALNPLDEPGLAEAQGVMLRNRLNPKAPVPVVYGTAKLGVILADIAVDGASTDNEDLYVPTVVCHGSRDDLGIAAIDNIYFNNQLAINNIEVLQSPYGATNLLFAKYLGTSTQNVADLTIGATDLDTVFSEWDKSTDDGRGMAGVLFKLIWDRDIYPASLPAITMEVRGNFIEDTRSEVSGVNITFADADPDTITRASGNFVSDGYVAGDRVDVSGSSSNDGKYTIASVAATVLTLVAGDALAAEGPAGGVTLKRWSHPDNDGGANPAMILRDYLLSTKYGAGEYVSESMIDQTSFETMANYCDDSINNPGGQARRFTANGWLDTGRPVDQNVDIIKRSMRANLIWQGDAFHLFIPRIVSASGVTLDTDTILGDWEFTVPGADTKVNLVRVTYIDPLKEYQADVIQWPESGATNPYLIADNNVSQERSLDLPLTQNAYTGQQIGMTLLKQSRHEISCAVTVNQTALQLEVGDVVAVTHETPGWTSKLFWVAALTILPDTDVRLTLIEYETSVTDNMTFADADPDTITRASGSWIDDGFVAYDEIDVSGSTSNDGTYIVAAVAASVLTLEAAETLANEGPVSCTVKTSIYALDTQSTAIADVADNLPRNPNDIADPTGLTLTATEAEGFYSATGQYTARIQVTLTDADDAFVDGYEVEARRTNEPTSGTNFDNYGFMEFGAAEFFVFPVNEGISWTVRVRSLNKQTGVSGAWVSAAVTPAYPAGSSTTAIEDGFSAAQNAAAPENGDETLGAPADVAYCNLEDANEIGTTYTTYHDMNSAGNMPGGETATLTLYKNDAPGSTNWTAVDSVVYADTDGNVSDQATLTYTGSMGADFDFRVVLTYSFAPALGEQLVITMHGEDHGSQAGVQYNKVTTAVIGMTLAANAVTSGGVLIDAAVAESNVTQHETAITALGTLTAHLLFTDNTYDIGASGATRPRTGYFATSVVIGTDPGGGSLLRVGGRGVFRDIVTIDGEDLSRLLDLIMYSDTNTVQFRTRRARGTRASPAAVQAGDQLFQFGIQAHDGTTFRNTGQLEFIASQNFSGGNRGSTFHIKNVLTGTTSRATRWKVTGDGGHLLAEDDNTYDIGASGATRPRNLYLSGFAVLGGALTVGGGLSVAVIAKTGAHTATASDHTINCDASGGAFTITLPTAVGIGGREHHIKSTVATANAVTVDADGTETIDGELTKEIPYPNSLFIKSDGANWGIH